MRLSDRELEVLELVAKGLVNKQIAERLSISDKTVQTYVTRVYLKMGVRNRASAVAKYFEHKLYRNYYKNSKVIRLA